MNKSVKYAIKIVLGLLTIFLCLMAYVAHHPDEGYHHCEAGQKDADPIYVLLLAVASLILFIWVWHKTKDKGLSAQGDKVECNNNL